MRHSCPELSNESHIKDKEAEVRVNISEEHRDVPCVSIFHRDISNFEYDFICVDDLLFHSLRYPFLLLGSDIRHSDPGMCLPHIPDYNILDLNCLNRSQSIQCLERDSHYGIHHNSHIIWLRWPGYRLYMHDSFIKSECNSVFIYHTKLFHSNYCLRDARLCCVVCSASAINRVVGGKKRPK